MLTATCLILMVLEKGKEVKKIFKILIYQYRMDTLVVE